ncbi:hypothetical protein [Pseudomonas nitroreducens]|uniref:hypothetical protein n=1 Tax=Pseudomonas nitroreducens TaxID=46680 RepID=UPI003F59C8CB|nr:hypothetical protein [Pseudomonas nitroreducens]MCP1685616.1 hypothetical protein [Pseudomonas nitroreducens]
MGAFLSCGLAFLVGDYVIESLRDVPTIDLLWLGQEPCWQLRYDYDCQSWRTRPDAGDALHHPGACH